MDRHARAARAQSGEIGADRGRGVGLLVPQRERTGHDLHAIALRPLIIAACIGRDDIDAVRLDMAAAHPVAGEQPHRAGDAQVP